MARSSQIPTNTRVVPAWSDPKCATSADLPMPGSPLISTADPRPRAASVRAASSARSGASRSSSSVVAVAAIGVTTLALVLRTEERNEVDASWGGSSLWPALRRAVPPAVLAVPAVWTDVSVARCFGIRRALGVDHFDRDVDEQDAHTVVLGRVRADGGWVSAMRMATSRPDAAVIAATTTMAVVSEYRSASVPASTAPTANPRSRHSR